MNIGRAWRRCLSPRCPSLLVVLAALAVVLVGLGASPCTALAEWHSSAFGDYDSYRDPSGLTGTDWMSGLSGERRLNEINMPGTHDTGCKDVWCYHWFGSNYYDDAITQKLYVRQQLDAGVRLFDIRLTDCHSGVNGCDADDLLLCHGGYKGGLLDLLYFCKSENDNIENFDNVLSYFADFLDAHPSETLIMTVKCEYSDDKDDDVMRKAEKAMASVSEYLYTADKMPRLKDVRGKIVVVGDDSHGKLNYGMQFGKTGRGTTVVGGLNTSYENTYSLSRENKRSEVRKFYDENNYRLPKGVNTHADRCLIAYTSANSILHDNPAEVAEVMNPFAYTASDALFKDKGRQFGWVYSDFVTGDMVRTLWETNYPSDLEYCTVTYASKVNGHARTEKERVLRGTTITVASMDRFGKVGDATWTCGGSSVRPGAQMVVDKDLTFSAELTREEAQEGAMTWGDVQETIDQMPPSSSLAIKLPNDIMAQAEDKPLTLNCGKKLTIDMDRCAIDANAHEGCPRRAFMVGAGSSLILKNGVVTGGYEDKGSAIYVERPAAAHEDNLSSLTLEDVDIADNTATASGGAVYLDANSNRAATVKLAGQTHITQNKGGNLFLCWNMETGGAKVEFDKSLDMDARIFVTLQPELTCLPKTLKDGLVFTKSLQGHAKQYHFWSDRGDDVVEKDGELAVKCPCQTVTYVNAQPHRPGSEHKELVRCGEQALNLLMDKFGQKVAFGGWYTDPELTKPFDFSKPLWMNWTLYGKWDPLRDVKLVDRAEAEQLGVAGLESVEADVEPTCTDAGKKALLVVDQNSKELLAKQSVAVAARGHEWSEWTVVREPEGARAGEEERVCKHCQERETRLVPASDAQGCAHASLTHVAGVEPTCASEGVQEHYQCADCGHLFLDETCAQELSYEGLAIAAREHVEHWEDLYAQEASCEVPGDKLSVCTCEHCGCLLDTKEEHTAATGHAWGDRVMLQEPTCDTDGFSVRTCKTCGIQDLDCEVKHGHDYQWVESPTGSGQATVYRDRCCTRCGKTLESEVVKVPVLAQCTVARTGSLGLVYTMQLPADMGVDWNDSYMEFEIGGKKARTVRVPTTEAGHEGDSQEYEFFCPLASIEMAERVKATFTYDGGHTVVDEGRSMQSCIKAFDKGLKQGKSAVALLHAIADYGYCAQGFLSKENGWKPGVDYAPMTLHYDLCSDGVVNAIRGRLRGSKATSSLQSSSIERVTMSLVLGSDVGMNIALTVPKGVHVKAEIDGWTPTGEHYRFDRVSPTRYEATVPGFKLCDLGKPISVHGDVNGQFALEVSPLDYINKVLEPGKLSPEGESAIFALLEYDRELKLFQGKEY